ncbi:MAG: glycerophosphodiester phosphodiesterase [Verrucomicrobiales bacterium]|nr:glycerophosphodiester phosphodiesterase [Verrucomicrobiales bacterium]
MKIRRILLPALLLVNSVGVLAADVEIIAHRGASYDAPENTLESVKLGWEQKADAVEVDVFLSKEGQVVLHHDATTKKLAGVDRKVAEQTYAELRKLDVGAWKGAKWKGIRIPKLDAVLATIPDGKRMFVEVKCGPEIIPALAKSFHNSGKTSEQLVVISFNYEVVKQAKAKFPKVKCFYLSSFKIDKESGELVPSVEELIAKAKVASLDGLNVSYKGLESEAFFKKVKSAGMGLFTWTVNSPDVARRLAKRGIDGITTDRPAWLREKLASADSE